MEKQLNLIQFQVNPTWIDRIRNLDCNLSQKMCKKTDICSNVGLLEIFYQGVHFRFSL